jgi:fatty-acyl-CoA synthase/long-chain acyl-CoA synthetase
LSILKQTQTSVLIVSNNISSENYLAVFESYRNYLPFLKQIIDMDTFCSKNTKLYEDVDISINLPNYLDPFVIIFTSGSTGKAKGVVLNHYNVITNAIAVVNRLEFKEDDVFLFAPPLFSMFGIGGTMMALLGGSKIVLMDHYNVRTALDLIEKEKVTIHSGNWTMFTAELNDPALGCYNLGSLRLGMIGGTVISKDLIKDVKEKMGLYLCNVYGMTEAAGGVTLVRPHANRKVWLTTVGYPLEGTEIKIISENGHELHCGETGELICRGVHFADYYLGDKGLYPVKKNGWFYTGDLGFFDSDGCIKILGRKKDLIKKGVYNIFTSELERVINTNPLVVDSSVVAIDKSVYAFVVNKPNAKIKPEDIISFCNQKNKRYYQVIDKVIIVPELPLTGTGKVDKIKLSQIYL